MTYKSSYTSGGDVWPVHKPHAVWGVLPGEAKSSPIGTRKFPEVEFLSGYETYEQFKAVIEEALEGDNETQRAIAMQGLILTVLLIAKNQNYGNSALEPMAVFAQGIDTKTRMGVRMDDKVNRIARGLNSADGEDAYRDLAGYLLLLLAGEQTGAL